MSKKAFSPKLNPDKNDDTVLATTLHAPATKKVHGACRHEHGEEAGKMKLRAVART
jgi:hypothetical protein